MKYEKKKTTSIFQGKSFYLVIALCLIAIGAASWMAYDRIQNETYPSPNSSINEGTSSLSPVPVPPTVEENDPPTDKVDAEKPDVPYESSSDGISSEEESAPKPSATATNFILPIMGNIAKEFSADTLVYSNTYKDMRLHGGIDIAAEENAVIKACGSGVVVAIIEDIKLGKYIEIDHGNNVTARYCGLDAVYVKEGDTVDAVTKLGTLGTVTEECLDDSHLHLEFYKDSKPVDPLSIIYPE